MNNASHLVLTDFSGDPRTKAGTTVRTGVGRLARLAVKRLAFGRGERGRSDTDMQVARLEHYDQLTGLLNRTRFRAEANERLVRDRNAAVLILDLDRFKDVNDTLGHLIGDQLILAIGERLRRQITGGQLLSRHGGDEFALLLPGFGEPRTAYMAARQVLASFRDIFNVGDLSVPIDASIGISVAPHHGATMHELLVAADLALRKAKRRGGGTIGFFEPHLHRQVVSRQTMQNELREALEREEFEIVFQPQVSFASRKVVGAEALLRWNHPKHGQLAPADFMSLLEEMPLSAHVGTWVIEKAIAQAGRWYRAGTPLCVAINLFASQFYASDLPELITDLLATHGLPAHCVELEITETIAIADCKAVAATLDELRKYGIGVALDDFGTGYASLNVFKKLPVSRLKIDKSFIGDLSSGSCDARLVEAILNMAATFRLQVTAEGVEAVDQENWLAAAGCERGQGFLYGAPMSGERILRLATELRSCRLPDGCVALA